jgi:hypothetical protein
MDWLKLHRLRRLCSRDGRFLVAAGLLLGLTRLGLSVFRLKRFRQALVRISGLPSGMSPSPTSDPVARVQWAVLAASRYVPGTRHCLTQALTAQVLLAHQGRSSQLRLGVAKDEEGQLKAHAWLESDGVAIFGAPDSGLQEYQLLPYLDQA